MHPEIVALLESLKTVGRSSPAGLHWQKYWESLRSRKSQNEPDPPVPLILAASGESAQSKQERLGAQLEWADKIGVLPEAIAELNAIPDECWNYVSHDCWLQDSYY